MVGEGGVGVPKSGWTACVLGATLAVQPLLSVRGVDESCTSSSVSKTSYQHLL